jgi:UDP-glucose 4-epimerase
MKYLVTGGAGFIGSHLVESLLGDGHEVIVIDDLSTGSLDNLNLVASNPKLDIVIGDILHLPELEYLIAKSDMVFHLAAAVGVELVVHDPVRTITTNVHGTEKVLKGAARKNTKLLIASTSEVYGKSEKENFSETDDLLIGPSDRCRWSYACSKLIDEFLAMAHHRATDLPVIVARFFNTVGPRQTGRYGMVMPRFIDKALKNETLSIYGDGEQSRCFCHVYDTVRALRLLAEAEGVSGQVFNIGTRREITIKDLASLLISKLDSKSTMKYIPYEEAYEAGFEDMRRRLPNIEKIKKVCSWQPKLSLENIIDDVAEYIKSVN